MATFETNRATARHRSIGASFGSTTFAAVVGRMAAWNDARVTRAALSRLSDHELDDIGLSRADISDIR